MVNWFTPWLAYCLCALLIDWLVVWLIDWSFDWSTDWSATSACLPSLLIDWLTDFLIFCLLSSLLTGWWSIDVLVVWLSPVFYRSGISDDGMPRAPSIDTSADGLLIPGVTGDKTDAEHVFSEFDCVWLWPRTWTWRFRFHLLFGWVISDVCSYQARERWHTNHALLLRLTGISGGCDNYPVEIKSFKIGRMVGFGKQWRIF